MRAVPFVSDPVRVVGARLSAYGARAVFTECGTLGHSLALPFVYDSELQADGTIRFVLATSARTLSVGSWDRVSSPAWTATGIGLYPGSGVAVSDGAWFYQKADGALCRSDGSETVLESPGVPACVAPLGADEYYTLYNHGNHYTFRYTGATSFMLDTIFYGQGLSLVGVDAVRAGGWDYLYFTDRDGRRAWVLKCQAGRRTHETRLLLPLDVVDDTSLFSLSGVSLVGGKPCATGVLRRASGEGMQVYLLGEEPSLGRDLYICPEEEGNYRGGKLYQVGQTLYYLGGQRFYSAPAPGWLGGDCHYQSESLHDLMVGRYLDAPGVFTARLKNGAEVARGDEVALTALVGGQEAELGRFSVDTVSTSEGEERTLTVAGRSRELKKLAQWVSDASYDHWSQTTAHIWPYQLSTAISTAGHWKPRLNRLGVERLNEDCYFYVNARSARHGFHQAWFYPQSGEYEIGVGLNYHHETRYEAGARLGIDPTDVEVGQCGHSGLFARLIVTAEGATLGIHRLSGSVWSGSSTVVPAPELDGSHYKLALRYADGQLYAEYRKGGALLATLSQRLEDPDHFPWEKWIHLEGEDPQLDAQGKGAVYARAVSTHARSYPMNSLQRYIPVSTTAGFPASGRVIVDGEIMTYGIKTITQISENVGKLEFKAVDGHTISVTGGGVGNLYPQEDHYRSSVLLVIDGPGKGLSYGILHYHPRTDTEPDRFEVEEKPSAVLGPGSVFRVVPALWRVDRAQNDTQAVSHGESTCSLYRAGPYVELYRCLYASSEEDLTLEEMAAKIAAKAGAAFQPRPLTPATVTPASGYRLWIPNPILRLSLPDVLDGTVVIAAQGNEVATRARVTFSQNQVVLRSKYGDITLAVPTGGQWKLSFQEELVSLWRDGQLIYSCYAWDELPLRRQLQISGTCSQALPIYIPEAHLRVDNYILDAGANGLSLLDQLVGAKRYFFREGESGLELFHNYQVANAGAPYRLAVTARRDQSEVGLATRVRVEGAEVYEQYDPAGMAADGNLFFQGNVNEINHMTDALYYAEELLAEYALGREKRSFSGLLDPRLEAGDRYLVTLPEGTLDLVVDEVVFQLMSAPSFDMQVSGRTYGA